MATGTAVVTGDLLTAAKMNLKQEDGTALANLGVLDQSGLGAQDLRLVCSENLSANRELTLTVNDAARTIDLGGNLTLAAAFTISGAFGLTLTVTALTSVTLPTTGTLATLAGSETLSGKTYSGTLAGAFTLSGATITFTGGTIALTGGAAYALGTTDAFPLNLQAGGANRLGISNTIGTFTVYQTTANYTLSFTDPAAARTVTFGDPGGADSVTYLAATQTLTNKTITAAALSGTFSGTPTFSGATVTFSGGTINLTAGAAYTIGTTDAFNVIIKANNASRFAISSTIGQLVVYQTTANITLAFADPAAARTITMADPGGAATLAYINQAQTFTVAHIFTGTPILRSTVAATSPVTAENTNDAASVLVGVLQGDRATPADADVAYISLRLSDSAGNQDEQARITWAATTVLDGATQDGDLVLSVLVNNSLTEHLRLDGSANQMQASRPLYITIAAAGLQVEHTEDAASVQAAIFEGNRATPADNDAAYISLRLSDSAGNQDEGARITWQATTVLSGATQDTDLILSALVNNVLTTFVTLDGSASEVLLAQNLRLPSAGSIFLVQAGGTYTVVWSNPAASRTLTIPDPLGADTFAFLSASQTLTGKTISLSGDLTFASALDIEVQANTAATLQLNAGADALLNVDSRNTTDNVIVFTWDVADPTIANVAGTTFNMHRLNAFTLTLSAVTGVTAINGLALAVQAPTIAQSGGAVTVTTASTLYLTPITAGALVTITNSRIIDTSVAGCFLTAAGVWTDASSLEHKRDIAPITLAEIPGLLDSINVVNFRRKDMSDGGHRRFGVIAEEVPDFLATYDHKGVAAYDMAGFSLAGLKWLKEENGRLAERVFALERKLARAG